MADLNTMGYGANTALDGADDLYVIDGGATDSRMLVGDFNLLPDGVLWDGKFAVTVASNNITVALKTRAGNNPSATEPVTVYIGGTRRRITAALSVTKNAGTGYFGLDARFATKEVDFFVYLIWNTTPATDIVDIGFGRRPDYSVYSDCSGTATAENYLATANASAPTSTDEMVNIGRFAATLSATPSFNWSVPTFTQSNLKNYPCYETRWLTWTPALTGFSADPVLVVSYRLVGPKCEWMIALSAAGTSNATTVTITMPIASANATLSSFTVGRGVDNGAECAPAFRMTTNTATFDVYKGPGITAWTNSGNKGFAGEGFYRTV